jgi:hypothetical protein
LARVGEGELDMRLRRLSGIYSVLAFVLGANAWGAEWGDLKARFVLDGAIPAPKKLDITKDQEFCGKHNLVDEGLVVNSANKGIANVVVFLYLAKGAKPPTAHESYASSAKSEVPFDNMNCRFEPRVVTLRTTQTLLVGNKDPVGHNTNITTLSNPGQNVLIPSNGSAKMNFGAVESLPSKAACNIHPWMTAYVVIKDHPYMGVSDKDGNLVIKNLPVGKWTFQFWQESSGYLTDVVVDGKKTAWARGRAELEIKQGGTDLKEIKLTPSLFKR